MARSDDMGDFFRIPADSRDLNYDKYFVEGEVHLSASKDYTSHNTKILNIDEVSKTLMKLELVQKAIHE